MEGNKLKRSPEKESRRGITKEKRKEEEQKGVIREKRSRRGHRRAGKAEYEHGETQKR